MGSEFNGNVIADHLRRHSPFEPHRLPMEEMEYTTLPEVMDKLEGRWERVVDEWEFESDQPVR